MATFPKSLPFLFLAIALLFSGKTLARESRFFSKVARDDPAEGTTVNKVQAKAEEPTFLPQTPQNAPYGLYGRKNDLPFSQTQVPTFDNNKNSKYFKNKETYETKEEATPEAATTPELSNVDRQKNYAAEVQGLDAYGRDGSTYNGEKQGMSDTRFMEKGRYYYDVNSEKPATFKYDGAYENEGERVPKYYTNRGYYSTAEGFKNNYYKTTSPRMFNEGGQALQEEEEFDFDP